MNRFFVLFSRDWYRPKSKPLLIPTSFSFFFCETGTGLNQKIESSQLVYVFQLQGIRKALLLLPSGIIPTLDFTFYYTHKVNQNHKSTNFPPAFWLGRLAFVPDGCSKPRADSGPNRPPVSAGQPSGGRAALLSPLSPIYGTRPSV